MRHPQRSPHGVLIGLALAVLTAAPAGAQSGPAPTIDEPQADVSFWVAGRFNSSPVSDTEQQYTWRFDPGVGVGIGVHHAVTRDVDFGVEGGFLIPSYEYEANELVLEGRPQMGDDRAKIAIVLTSARMKLPVETALAPYLAVGGGLMVYRLSEVDRTDPDWAALLGVGIELPRDFFLQADHSWTFRKNPFVSNAGTARHLQLKLGTRFGW